MENFTKLAYKIFSKFDLILTSNTESKNYFEKLGGKNIYHFGNIKYSNKINFTEKININENILNNKIICVLRALTIMKKSFV